MVCYKAMASTNREGYEIFKSKMEEDVEDSADVTNTGEGSVTNPFESQQTIDSYLQPSFSPNVFSLTSPSTAHTQKSGSFWTIDQIAILNPTDIDVSALHAQQNLVRCDPASERLCQQALTEFWESHADLSSPAYTSDPTKNHYLALISPSPAQLKKGSAAATPLTSKMGFSSSTCSSQLRVRKLALSNMKSHCKSNSKTGDESRSVVKKESKNISTQTTLTLPKDFDLEEILAKYFTFGLTKENTSDTAGNTSLRRKLFFPDGREVSTRDKNGEINLNALRHINDIDDIDDFIDSPVSLKKITPRNNNLTPLNHCGSHANRSRTPSSQSHYSSSPVHSVGNFDVRTPSGSDTQMIQCGSGVRPRRRLHSRQEYENMKQCLSTPEVSPVKTDDFITTRCSTALCILPDTDNIDESMSFQVCSDDYKTAPESSDNSRSPHGNMESSRRELGIQIPPFSPIQPIKQNCKMALTDNIVESTQQSMSAVTSLNEFCRSSMLSPIQSHENAPLLSSTTTRPATNTNRSHLLLIKTKPSTRPFQGYEDVQYSCENKENIQPYITTCSTMLSSHDHEEDVSMTSQHTSVCHESTYNDNEDFHCHSHRETSVLQKIQGHTGQNAENVSSKRQFHQFAEDIVISQQTPTLRSKSPKRITDNMDFAVSKCFDWIEKAPTLKKQTAGKNDSGYSSKP